MFLDAFWHTWPALEKNRVLFRFGCHFGGHWRASGRIFVLNVFLEAFLRVTFFTDGSKRPPGCPQTPFAPHLRSDFFLELYLLLPLHFHFSLQRQRKTLPADGMSSLSRGAAMTRRRRLQYVCVYVVGYMQADNVSVTLEEIIALGPKVANTRKNTLYTLYQTLYIPYTRPYIY